MDLAISRPIPLVAPVTMQVMPSRWGRDRGFSRWLAAILWKRNSPTIPHHPLAHSIQPKSSFFLRPPPFLSPSPEEEEEDGEASESMARSFPSFPRGWEKGGGPGYSSPAWDLRWLRGFVSHSWLANNYNFAGGLKKLTPASCFPQFPRRKSSMCACGARWNVGSRLDAGP